MNPARRSEPPLPDLRPSRPERLWRSALWVIALALLIFAGLFAYRLSGMLRARDQTRVGDGRTVASYGFAHEPVLVPVESIVAGGLSKDGLRALDNPVLMTAAQVDSLNAGERGKYLVSADRVIGMVSGGVARAYPLRVLNWHEVINDTLGGQPVAITYSPLCDSSVGFRRMVAGEVLEFGVSGLLCNSNLIMYDRRSGAVRESLWCQLQGRAIAGPAAGARQTLDVLPIAVVSWQTWRQWHPETTVPFPERDYRARYKRSPYGSYFGSDRLHFPVQPLPPAGGLRYKDRVVAVRLQQGWQVVPLSRLAAAGQGNGSADLPAEMGPLRIHASLEPAASAIADAQGPLPLVQSFWFAWHALRAERPPTGAG